MVLFDPESSWNRRDACLAAGCRFEFSAKTVQPLTKLLRENGKNFEPEENLQPVLMLENMM